MLALVRLHASERYLPVVSYYDALPVRPLRISGAAVRCEGTESLETALRWHRECVGRQVRFPLALVVPRDATIMRRIVLEAASPAALLFEDELSGSRLPDEVVEVLWHGGILLQLEDAVLREAGVELDLAERAVFRQIVSAGAEGRRAASAAACAGMSESTLRRWLSEHGLPPAGTFLRRIRIESLRRLEHAGMDAVTASRICGWSGPRASHLARMRSEGRARTAAAC
ncbi:MAG TPA: hypothetical protein VGO40_22615 [Longimicrobium sp.]|jgi:hypothetical protein|nr:hypothetical protein [Longimicrobium sp.]